MKELSIEEKAKAYDRAVNEIRNLRDKLLEEGVINKDGVIFDNFNRIFPELKESEDEDENIREKLIRYFSAVKGFSTLEYNYGITNEEAIAWLKKQGEQNPTNKVEPKFKVGDMISNGTSEVKIIEINDNSYSVTNDEIENDCNLSNWVVYFKDQDNWELVEQNHADKIEPKFKVGDWITNSKCTWKIDSIDEDMYYNNHCGIDCGDDIKSIDEEYHLWTIQDARDGDILSDRYSIVIFRGIGNEKWKDVIDYHIGLFTNSQHLVVQKGLSHWGRINEVTLHPATKEQRDQLEKAIVNAGYKWNKEERKLKKIEQKSANNQFTPEQASVLDKHIDKFLEQKSTWSEEDEKMIKSAVSFIEHSPFTTIGKGKGSVIVWLKSLKERYTWKPSDEQMESLDDAIAICSERDYETKCRLDNLRQDLKKLREE